MRISDWSSDVCSSDLSPPRRNNQEPNCLYRQVSAAHFVVLRQFLHGTLIAKIGRASCRERVCQYGVDLGGRRIIKKKKDKTHSKETRCSMTEHWTEKL